MIDAKDGVGRDITARDDVINNRHGNQVTTRSRITPRYVR